MEYVAWCTPACSSMCFPSCALGIGLCTCGLSLCVGLCVVTMEEDKKVFPRRNLNPFPPSPLPQPAPRPLPWVPLPAAAISIHVEACQ